MDALHLEAGVIAGDSMGSFVAQRFAMDYPDRSLGLVLMGSCTRLRDRPGVRKLWDSTVSKLTDPVDEGLVRDLHQSMLAGPVPQAFIETMVQESLRVPAFVWKAAFQGFLADDSSSEHSMIKAPTLILWGDQDPVFSRDDQDVLAAAIPEARLVVYPGTGH